MKFLCDNCKAKYQIADEKVAGKTVRMKCRKCGHQIEVRAAVTETSVSTAPPKAPSDAPARPQAPATRQNLATSLAGQKPRAPMAPQAAMTQPMGSHGPTGGGGALAGAFQRNVQEAPHSSPPPAASAGERELSVTDEWYVAINGVPVGPVRISELRRKAAAGAVTEDSLCWQEGLEEWRPVRSVPELAALVREAAQGNRPSLTAPAPSEQRPSSPPRPPQRPASPAPRAPEPSRPSEPPTAPPPRHQVTAPLHQRSNVVPLRPAAQTGGDDLFGALGTGSGSGAAAALAPQLTPAPAPLAPLPAPVPIADPFAVPPPATAPLASPLAAPAAPAPSSPSTSTATASGAIAPVYPSMAPAAPRRQGVPLWFWLVALFTVSFGGVAAYAMFFRPVPQPAPVVIQMPATATTGTTPATDVPPPPPATDTTPTASASSASVKVATGPSKGTSGAAPAPTEKKTTDISGLLGDGKGGPGVGAGGPGPAGGGGGLDQSSVERVVASHRQGVKRTCWERGGADQKSSVNVTVSATVGPDGSVTSTSSSGDDPVVAKCIESQVRSWKFNAPGSTTTINIPFKFVRQ
ncbi:MAG: zinc-ribbon domain-containing protein [Deltaproteobacteria bacterium]|nr:zinc-ribbon domain-containing protein [Deltaproteobacteria bacterium]